MEASHGTDLRQQLVVSDELGLARLVLLPDEGHLVGLGLDVLIDAVHCMYARARVFCGIGIGNVSSGACVWDSSEREAAHRYGIRDSVGAHVSSLHVCAHACCGIGIGECELRCACGSLQSARLRTDVEICDPADAHVPQVHKEWAISSQAIPAAQQLDNNGYRSQVALPRNLSEIPAKSETQRRRQHTRGIKAATVEPRNQALIQVRAVHLRVEKSDPNKRGSWST